MKKKYDIKFGVKKDKCNVGNLDYVSNTVKGKCDSAQLLSCQIVRETSINIGPSYKSPSYKNHQEKIEHSINENLFQQKGLINTIYVSKFNEYEDNLGAPNTIYAHNFNQDAENDSLKRFIEIEKLNQFHEINNSINNRVEDPNFHKVNSRKLSEDDWRDAINMIMEWSDVDISRQNLIKYTPNININTSLKEFGQMESSALPRFSVLSDSSNELPVPADQVHENTVLSDNTVESIYLVGVSGD
jgi:hypothetical protein